MRKPRFLADMEVLTRRRRNALFVGFLRQLERPASVLDVGGTFEYWKTVGYPTGLVASIVLLNCEPQDAPAPFTAVTGDARDLSRYGDGQFDVVFSNSVIGHVGSFADQQRMAQEMARVGRRFWVQTPNRAFPLDWRTLIPFFHFLPHSVQSWCFERFRVGLYRRAASRAEAMHLASRIRNLRLRELRQLFPGATVVNERVAGLTKSFIAHNFPIGACPALSTGETVRSVMPMAGNDERTDVSLHP